MSGYDLYTLAGGRWMLHQSFDDDEQDLAMETAIDLKQSGHHQAVYLLWPRYNKVIYSHTKRDVGKFNYSQISNVIEQEIATPGSSGVDFGGPSAAVANSPKVKVRMRTDTGPQKVDPMAIPAALGLGGAVAGGITFLTMLGSNQPPGNALMTGGMIFAAGALSAFFVFQKNDAKNKEIELEIERAKNYDKLKILLENMLAAGKKLKWDKKTGSMEGDTHFAMVLYLAGANAAGSEEFGFPKSKVHDDLVRLLRDIGITAASSEQFLRNVDEFLLYPRYHAMYLAGYEDAKERFEKQGSKLSLKDAFDRWKIAEQVIKTNDKAAAVMFTDIKDFTMQTNEYGHDWTADVVKAHNEIVRAVLRQFGGREVKHTGDGIMASFPTVPDAVDAAIGIQRGVNFFNTTMPSRAFQLRIGVSAGEPIHMEGDLFGAPVNLAARLMQFIDGMEVALSHNIPGAIAPEFYKLDPIHGCELKGFSGPQTIYKLIWQQSFPPAFEDEAEIKQSSDKEKAASQEAAA